MTESTLATIQRRQIEITVGELLLTSDHYMRLEIAERLRHLIAHADPTLNPVWGTGNQGTQSFGGVWGILPGGQVIPTFPFSSSLAGGRNKELCNTLG